MASSHIQLCTQARHHPIPAKQCTHAASLRTDLGEKVLLHTGAWGALGISMDEDIPGLRLGMTRQRLAVQAGVPHAHMHQAV